jgi:hypothetical protein
VIDDATLAAYIDLFSKPLTQEHITSCLALFGWTPEAIPLVDGVVDGVV